MITFISGNKFKELELKTAASLLGVDFSVKYPSEEIQEIKGDNNLVALCKAKNLYPGEMIEDTTAIIDGVFTEEIKTEYKKIQAGTRLTLISTIVYREFKNRFIVATGSMEAIGFRDASRFDNPDPAIYPVINGAVVRREFAKFPLDARACFSFRGQAFMRLVAYLNGSEPNEVFIETALPDCERYSRQKTLEGNSAG